MSCRIYGEPKREVLNGVALDLAKEVGGTGVTLCFTERTGGKSVKPYESLNLGMHVGDNPLYVEENRKRVFEALGAAHLLKTVITPHQVHGDEIAVVNSQNYSEYQHSQFDADGVVCTVPNQAVMLLFADCVPVVLVSPNAFAVVHSGWRGTLKGISGKAARVLIKEASCELGDIHAYIGPHIKASHYEVSSDLARTFVDAFGTQAVPIESHLDMDVCIRLSLQREGILDSQIYSSPHCTAQEVSRFFSFRAENGVTGRHAAIAFMQEKV